MFAPNPDMLEIELLITPDSTLLVIAALIEPMRAANRVTGQELYRWRISSTDGAPVTTAAGIALPVAGRFVPEGRAPLIVTGSYRIEAQTALTRVLSQAGRHRPLIGAVDAAPWLLARAGLLTGYRATIHREDHEIFAACYPDVVVEERRFLHDRNRLTASGAGPTLDLMLHLIGTRQGASLAMEVARLLAYHPGEEGRAPGPLTPPGGDLAVARAVELMIRHLADPLPVTAIAREVGLSARHLQARFVRALETPPQAHYLDLRLAEARRLLRETQVAVTEIAARTGFASAASFSRAYRRCHGESASDTRRGFVRG